MEMRDEVLSSVCAQDIHTSGYKVSDLGDVEFYWENDQMFVDAVFIPGEDTPFSPSTIEDFEMIWMAENPILIDEEQDKENSPPPPTTPFSERSTQIPVLMRKSPFGTRIDNVPENVYRTLYEQFILL